MKKTTLAHILCLCIAMLPWRAIADPANDSAGNSPYNIRPLKIQLLVLTMDVFSFGAGLQADYHFKHAIIEAQWRKAMYATLGGKPDAGDEKDATTNSAKSFSNFEADGEYYFSDRLVSKRYKNILSSYGNSYTYNIDRADARRVYAVKAGVFLASGFVATDSAGRYNTNYQTRAIAGGLARKRIDKFSDNRRHDGVREVYLQLLMGATTLDDLKLKPGQPASPAPVFNNIGWRLGGQRYGEHFYVGYELGQRPALVNPDKFKAAIPFNYFLINFGFTIYGNEKWK